MVEGHPPAITIRDLKFTLLMIVSWAAILITLGILVAQVWDLIMVFLGSYLVGDFFVGWLIRTDSGQPTSPLLGGNKLTIHQTFLAYGLGILISSILAVFLVFVAKVIVVLDESSPNALVGYDFFVVITSVFMVLFLLVDVSRFFVARPRRRTGELR